MKKCIWMCMMVAGMISTFAFAGCGKNMYEKNDKTTGVENTAMTSDQKDRLDDATDPDKIIEKQNDATDPTEMWDDYDMQDMEEEAGDLADDIKNEAEKDVDSVTDGINDALDNLGGGSFDRYEDARDYLFGRLKKDNATADYELREETQALTSYNSNDSDALGYEYHVYEKDGGEKIGIYYVDKDNGKIYRYMGKNAIESY